MKKDLETRVKKELKKKKNFKYVVFFIMFFLIGVALGYVYKEVTKNENNIMNKECQYYLQD